MERPEVMVQKLTDAEVERLCCRQDFTTREAAAEVMQQSDGPSSGSHIEEIYIKTEMPDPELEAVSVKDEPVDWHQQPQASLNPSTHAVTLKKEVEDDCAEVRSRLAGAEDKLREGSSGACNTSVVHQRPAGASPGGSNSLPSYVSGRSSGVEATPNRLMPRLLGPNQTSHSVAPRCRNHLRRPQSDVTTTTPSHATTLRGLNLSTFSEDDTLILLLLLLLRRRRRRRRQRAL